MQPVPGEHPFKIIAFDWDGTAVKNRDADAREVAEALADLLRLGAFIAVITGTNFDNVDRQFSSLIKGPFKQRLFICANRGSEVFGFDRRSDPVLLLRRTATDDENRLLNKVAEEVKRQIESQSRVSVNIIYDRLNRRKIDLIPEWPDPPKAEIDRLLQATEDRLKHGGYAGGIKGAFDLAVACAHALGLPDPRITSDVKHIEIGLTDKSDSIAWTIEHLARNRNIAPNDILILGDEFGPIAGFEGSDFRMVVPLAQEATYVSVGLEPNGVPDQVNHIGGGPERFLRLMREQEKLHEIRHPTKDTAFLLVEEGYNPLREREIESLFTVANGYLGTRGSLEERAPGSDPATLVGGLYDQINETSTEEFVVAPDWLYGRIYVAGEKISIEDRDLSEHRRVLDMKKGILFRTWRHHDPREGRITSIETMRFASLAEPHGVCLRITALPENYRGEIKIATGIRLCEHCRPTLKPVEIGAQNRGGIVISAKTGHTNSDVAAAAVSTPVRGLISVKQTTEMGEFDCLDDWQWTADVGQAVGLEKFAAIYTSKDSRDPTHEAMGRAAELAAEGFDQVLLRHIEAWSRRWSVAHISIEADEEAQLAINFAIYHLISAGPADDKMSISARALSGTVYKGHIFWDTEMFMLPFFIYTHPPSARAILMYRYHTLPAAREKAARLGYRGALFAWESAASGREMTPAAVLAPTGEVIPILSGKQEHHINSAVAFGTWSYWNATHDAEFLFEAGAEVLIETARFWVSRVERRGGVFHINNVEGPDEYHEGVDDNLYTNLMAAWNLKKAAEAVDILNKLDSGRWLEIRERLGVDPEEPGNWLAVAGGIYGDLLDNNRLLEQFDGYFNLQDIDTGDYEPRTAPIDIILGREKTAESQLVKQADVVMALYLLEDEFDRDIIERNFEYYDRRTGHGSSLSPSIYGLVAARLGLTQKALHYFDQAARIDLADNMGNASGGIHTAALGGLWLQTVMGFVGLRVDQNGVFLHPLLPLKWPGLRFNLLWRGDRLEIDIKREDRLIVSVNGKDPVRVGIFGRSLMSVEPGHSYRSQWDGHTWTDFSPFREEA